MGASETSILIIEDDLETLRLLSDSLSPEYDCVSVSSADEATSQISARHFDLVIVNSQLTDTPGLDVCRLVSQMELDTIIIAITGMTDMGYRLRATRQGVWYCLERPIDPEKLLIYIESGLRCQAIARLRHRGAPASSNARGVVVN